MLRNHEVLTEHEYWDDLKAEDDKMEQFEPSDDDLADAEFIEEDLETDLSHLSEEELQTLQKIDDPSLVDILGIYFSDIPSKLLNVAEERELGTQILAGKNAQLKLKKATLSLSKTRELQALIDQGEQAQKSLALFNTRWAIKLALKYQHHGLSLKDLIQDANVGLVVAASKFDVTRNVRFTGYAAWWIRQSISRAIANTSRTIRFPTHISGMVPHTLQKLDKFQQEFGRKPSVEELMASTGFSRNTVSAILKFSAPPLSLDEPVEGADDTELVDTLSDGKDLEHEVLQKVLKQQLATLLHDLLDQGIITSVQLMVMTLHYGLDDRFSAQSLEVISQKLGMTREGARQVEQRGIKRIRESAQAPLLYQLLQDLTSL